MSAPKRCGEKLAAAAAAASAAAGGAGVGVRKGPPESESSAAEDADHADHAGTEAATTSDPGTTRKASRRSHSVGSSLDGAQTDHETAVKGSSSESGRGRGIRKRWSSAATRSTSEPPPPKETSPEDAVDSASGSPGYPFRSRKRSASGEGNGPNYSDVGEGRRRRTEAELLAALDLRVFTYLRPGECQEKGCKLRKEAHCHRGPGCDCTR